MSSPEQQAGSGFVEYIVVGWYQQFITEPTAQYQHEYQSHARVTRTLTLRYVTLAEDGTVKT